MTVLSYDPEVPSIQETAIEHGDVVWRLAQPGGGVDRVSLWSDFDLGDTSFAERDAVWELRRSIEDLPRVDRLEYLFEVTSGGNTHPALDPGNPLQVAGAFGDHSWIALGYQPPGWLKIDPVHGDRQALVVNTPVGAVHGLVWAPQGTDPRTELPLLLSHDGPEMDSLGELTRFIGTMIAAGRLPRMRVGLLAPGPRDERYAANPAYAEALCRHVIPAVLELAPSDDAPVLMGQSLGAVAALHAEWSYPGTFSGLLLQSGSFFTPELDGQESGYAQWGAVTDFVREVLGTEGVPTPPGPFDRLRGHKDGLGGHASELRERIPITVCFGSAEENASNNRQMADKLAELGYDVSTGSVRDGHNFTCWRDLLDPHLTDLLRKAF